MLSSQSASFSSEVRVPNICVRKDVKRFGIITADWPGFIITMGWPPGFIWNKDTHIYCITAIYFYIP